MKALYRRATSLLLLAAVGLTGLSSLAPGSIARAQQASAAEAYTFAFENAEISAILQEVLGQAGVPYVIDPAVTGRISFRIEQRLTREQLLTALEAVLAANNVAMVRNNGQLLITPQSKARASAGIRSDVRTVGGPGYEVVAVPLGYAQPSEVARALEAMSTAETVLYANDKLGLLLLGGTGQQLKGALETLKVFDQSAFQESKIRWFELGQAQANTVAAEVERIVQGAGLAGVSIVPLRRLNGVIVFGRSTEALDEIGRWVRRLDTPGKDLSSNLYVYRPQFSSAESLAQTLSSVLGTTTVGSPAVSAPSPTVTPSNRGASPGPIEPPGANLAPAVGGGEEVVRVGLDRESNTLLIFASSVKWVQIQRILMEVDRPQRQVLIEASIVEVTLGREFAMGVDWSLFSDNLQVSGINNSAGVVAPSFPGLSIAYLGNDIEAALSALGSRTSLEVVSAPKIIALDNRTARLQVGDQVPVVTRSAQSPEDPEAALINSVEYRSTGVLLNVTPRISGDNRIVLDVSQEVSSVARTSTSGIDSPTIQQRRFESTLVIANGATVALGGLIGSQVTDNNAGIPGLKDVPVLGALFSSQERGRRRSELIVLLSARIISDAASSDRAMADLATDMKELQARGLMPAPAQP